MVVAAEMVTLRSGLGYMIIDARNAGNRYDLCCRHGHLGIAGLLFGPGCEGWSAEGALRYAR